MLVRVWFLHFNTLIVFSYLIHHNYVVIIINHNYGSGSSGSSGGEGTSSRGSLLYYCQY